MNSKKTTARRRAQLVQNVCAQHKSTDGVILLLANFELESVPYRQESTFYYYTGSQEPASALLIDCAHNTSTLFVPNTGGRRAQWFANAININTECADKIGVDEIRSLGEVIPGYSLPPLHEPRYHANLMQELQKAVTQNKTIFACLPKSGARYTQQVAYLQQLCAPAPELAQQLIDISPIVSMQRAIKDEIELEYLSSANGLTLLIHKIVEENIDKYPHESNIQADIRSLIAAAAVDLAFGPIVASGTNSCIVHYQDSLRTLKKDDVVIVDCGARVNGYCADITRTYAVSKKFTARQQEIYDLVAQAQALVATQAKPDMYLSNPEQPEKSLNHIMRKFFINHGYEHAVVHGVGHFLGLDVHDIGEPALPLQENMVITIEPGLYLLKEGFGVRIEDDYVIKKDGAQKLNATFS